jgi:hypothetical protein
MLSLAVTLWHWLTQLPHFDSGLGYQFWSGIGSDLGEITLLVGALAWWKHRNCQVKWCPFFHLHAPTNGGHFVCKKHHPEYDHKSKLSHQDVIDAHEAD